jgi:hypothetical protein
MYLSKTSEVLQVPDESPRQFYEHLYEVSCPLFFNIHLFTYAYILWVISLHCPLPPPSPPLPSLVPDRSCSALITNFVEEKTQA